MTRLKHPAARKLRYGLLAATLSLQALAAEAPSADFWEFYENFAEDDGQVIDPEDTLLQSAELTEHLQDIDNDQTPASPHSPETTP